MKLIDRIIFVVVGLFLIAISAGAVLVAIDFVDVMDLISLVENIKIGTLEIAILFGGAFILFIVAVKILFVRPKKKKIPAYTIQKTDDSEISVAISAVENTVRLSLAAFEEIKDSRIHISVLQNGMMISAKVAVPTDVIIPELLNRVKQYIKDFTEEHTGVKILHVRIVAIEYKTVDTANERKKIENAKRRETARNADAYAKTHARIVLSNRQNEDTMQEDTDYGNEPEEVVVSANTVAQTSANEE